MKPAANRVLVVALDNLGDAVMAASILKPLKNFLPQARIGMWVKSYAAGLFGDQSLVDVVHASDPFWDKSPGAGKGSFFDFFSAFRSVRRARYDVAFVLNTEWRRSLACALASIPIRIGYDRRQSASFLTHTAPLPETRGHFVDEHRRLVEGFFGRPVLPDECVPRLDVSSAETAAARAWLVERSFTGPFTAVHLFSGDEDKNWPLTCWIELMERRLKLNSGERFVAICGPGEDKKFDAFRSHFKNERIALLVAPPLAQLKAILKLARLFLGGDSGLGHVSAALGTPVISLFGATNPERSRPIGHGYARTIFKSPLRLLPVEDVLGAIADFEKDHRL